MNTQSQRCRKHFDGGSSWYILAVVLLSGTVGPTNIYKIPPVLPILMRFMDLSAGRGGLLMSILCLSGLALSLPGGFVFQKLGYRTTGVLAMGLVFVGAVLGSFSSSAGSMVATRLIEGIGAALMSLTGPALISIRFSGRRRAIALGIWSTYVPFGAVLSFGGAPFLASHCGWQSVWLAGGLYALVCGILYCISIRPMPEDRPTHASLEGVKIFQKAGARKVMLNRDIWLLCLAVFCGALIFFSLVTWLPTYFFTAKHTSLAFSSQLGGLVVIVGIIGSPMAGFVLGRMQSPKSLYILAHVLIGILGPLALYVSPNHLLAYVIVFGFIASLVPPSTYFIMGKVVNDKRLSGMAMGVLNTGMYAGMLVGPVIFGYTFDRCRQWEPAFWLVFPLGVLGGLLMLFVHVRGKEATSLAYT
jgi:MFS family permease